MQIEKGRDSATSAKRRLESETAVGWTGDDNCYTIRIKEVSMARHGEIVGKILAYLTARPEEGDTLEGIMNWWMKSDKGKHAIDELEDTLNLMFANGELEKIKVKKDIFVYKVKKGLKV